MSESHIDPDDQAVLGSSGARSFLLGWWVNRRFTRNLSSVVLASGLGVAAYTFIFERSFLMHDPDYTIYSVAIPAVLVLNVIFFPAVREVYYRLMRPLHEGLSGVWVGGLLLLILFIIRFAVLTGLWVLSIPLGIVAGLYLSAGEAWGIAWRYK